MRTPVSVGFRKTTCVRRLKGIASSEEGQPATLSAKKGRHLCLVALTATNAAAVPVSWGADPGASLVASDGRTYPLDESRWSAAEIAAQADEPYAGDGDLIPRGRTEYNYVLFSLPTSATPVRLRLPNGL